MTKNDQDQKFGARILFSTITFPADSSGMVAETPRSKLVQELR